MGKYLVKRLLHGVLSLIAVVAIVMLLIYSLMNRDLIFASDPQFSKKTYNELETYKYSKWESYGYVDYVPYADFIAAIPDSEFTETNSRKDAANIGQDPSKTNATAKKYIKQFTEEYESNGYTIVRLDYQKKTKQKAVLFAYKDIPIYTRLWNYFASFIHFDNIHYVERTYGTELEGTGLTFTLFDPVYNTDPVSENADAIAPNAPSTVGRRVFSPAVIGQGTEHKYLLYFDNQFPYFHQNFFTLRFGTSYSVRKGIDVYETLFTGQDPNKFQSVTFPTGLVQDSPRNIHTARYVPNSRGVLINGSMFVDDYTEINYFKQSMSKTGFSFVIGIISTVISYLLGIPLGLWMALRKDKLVDKIGTIYIIFIIAVPSLAYIFLFKAIGGSMGLPVTFNLEEASALMYILPIVSLALPSIAGLMKWIRRYMIDQMNSDYVKFARSGGLSEGEIFSKHILKNAAIPIIHGIPGSILGALFGAIITESIYRVPGAGGLLTDAINVYDNGVIVGLTLFYGALSVLSIILGDILMAMVDPRISFTDKAR